MTSTAPEHLAANPIEAWRVLDALDDGIYTIDLEGDCLSINAAAIRILGYDDADELLGHNMHDLIHHTRPGGERYPKHECPLIQTAQGGHPVRLANETLWRRNDTPFLAEYSAFPITVAGRVTGSVVTFREEVVRADARSRLAVQYAVSRQLAAAAGATGVVATIYGILETIGRGLGWDTGRYFMRAEGQLRLMTEWPRVALSDTPAPPTPASPIVERAWATRRAVHDTVRAGIASAFRSSFAFPVLIGIATEDDAGGGVIEFRSPRTIPADESLLGSVEALGQMIGQAIERHRIAAALRISETRFRVIADAIPQLSWMTDATGAVTWYNQRWYDYTGTDFQKMSGWGWSAVQHPDHLERVERGFRDSLASGEPWEDTFPLRAADGRYRWFLSRALPIRANVDPDAAFASGQDAIIGWFGSNTDITAMRDAERSQTVALAEAEAANLAKSLFLANMSHELRTPLSAIIGYSEMLIEEVEDGEEPGPRKNQVVGDVRKIETNARHLLGLINDVLDLSKVESGKMEAYAETFPIAAIVSDVAATVTSLIEKNGNRLELHLADDLGTMHSDVTRIRQMLLNLLSNAAKFTDKGTITLAAARQPGPASPKDIEGPNGLKGDDWVRFTVSDSGLGMTPEQLAHLFERFQQADPSTTRRFGGTGLGLSLTKVFVQLLGGDVEVESVAGRGSTFTLLIPATLPIAPATAEAETDAAMTGRQIVLVIDDDATQRDLASRFLERTGFAPVTANDGATGLARARDILPHAILLDVTMPGMDGWSVLSSLKADPVTSAIPVVMVTLVDEKPLAKSLGASDYVMKPVEWDRLRLVLDRFRQAEGDILVVDDESDARQRLRRILETNGWSVAEATNGREALDHVAGAIPRLILLDLSMPLMDGFEFLRRLRELPSCGTVPVIVLTALDLTLDDRRRLRGANQVLNKGSTSLNELIGKLHALEGLGTPA